MRQYFSSASLGLQGDHDMMKLLNKAGVFILLAALYSCATAPETGLSEAAGTAAEAPETSSEEKDAVWVTVKVDEFLVSQETIKYEDGFIDGYRLYEYNDNGRILNKTQVGSDERVISEEDFEYNSDDLLTESHFYSGGDEISYSLYKYDGDKQLIEESYYNPQGDLLSVSRYEYNDQGLVSKWISGDSGGIPMMYTEYEYKKGKLVQMNYFMPDGEMEGFTKMEYEGDVLMLEASYSASSRLEKKTEYTVENGIVTSVSYYSGNNLMRVVEYLYDDAGNVVTEVTKNKRGSVIDIVEKEYVVLTVEKTVLQ